MFSVSYFSIVLYKIEIYVPMLWSIFPTAYTHVGISQSQSRAYQ